jgi:hypothetical protein
VLNVAGAMLRLRKIDKYDRIAVLIIIFAASMRILLNALGWPPTDSDEGVMAIMATNIAYRGARPLMFYGQDYMGTIEAYLGAGFFHLFGGPSLFALRLGVILQVTFFLICMYLLTRLLFSKSLAIVTLLILSVGSIPVLTRQMIATGGSSQTLFFGSLAFLLATWLSSTYQRRTLMGVRRLVAYAVWGLAVGLGIWSDLIVLPFLAMAGLLLLLFCWRELLAWRWLIVLFCIAIGIIPLILYDLSVKLTPWGVLTGLMHGRTTAAPQMLPGIVHNIIATVQVSIPTATGNPFCPVVEVRVLGDNAPHIWQCTFIHASWGGGYLLLLICALGVTLRSLWYLQLRGKNRSTDAMRGTTDAINRVPTQVYGPLKRAQDAIAVLLTSWRMNLSKVINAFVSPSHHQIVVRYIARLLLFGAVVIAICVYTVSSAPAEQPGYHARYLVSLLIATPALIFPLWNAATLRPVQTLERIKVYGCRGILTLVWSCLLIGTIIAFSEVPAARAADQQRQDLIAHLKRIGVTRFYTEYWTCYNLIFASHEQVVCAILKSDLHPWDNRAPRYFAMVKADPHAAYVFPLDTNMLPLKYHDLPAVEQKVAHAGPGKYRRYEFDGYVVYKPV